MNKINLLIVKPGAQKILYQDLSKDLTGIEPPLWAALLAGFIRDKGFMVDLIDETVNPKKVIPTIKKKRPLICAIVVSGINPSASTMNMIGTRSLLKKINSLDFNVKPFTILIGLHPAALPEQTIEEEDVDFVCDGEGFYTLLDLLNEVPLYKIRNLWRDDGCVSNKKADLIDFNDLPLPAWDLLPMHKYRAHNWHSWSNNNIRQPYGVIYTSFGCCYNCSFCGINAMFKKHVIRYLSVDNVIKQVDLLVNKHKIKNIKIADEMFDLHEDHVVHVCAAIANRKYDLNIWAYARIDTINERKLKFMKKAGINWIGYGIEAANVRVKNAINKEQFDIKRVKEIVKLTHKLGINVGGNYIFGLPEDDLLSMKETFKLARELNCEYNNIYCYSAFPGAPMYKDIDKKDLPATWDGYSQFGYNSQPLPTKYLTPEQILKFRDQAYISITNSKRYQNMILKKFGKETLKQVQNSLKYKLKRRILE